MNVYKIKRHCNGDKMVTTAILASMIGLDGLVSDEMQFLRPHISKQRPDLQNILVAYNVLSSFLRISQVSLRTISQTIDFLRFSK